MAGPVSFSASRQDAVHAGRSTSCGSAPQHELCVSAFVQVGDEDGVRSARGPGDAFLLGNSRARARCRCRRRAGFRRAAPPDPAAPRSSPRRPYRSTTMLWSPAFRHRRHHRSRRCRGVDDRDSHGAALIYAEHDVPAARRAACGRPWPTILLRARAAVSLSPSARGSCGWCGASRSPGTRGLLRARSTARARRAPAWRERLALACASARPPPCVYYLLGRCRGCAPGSTWRSDRS